MATEITAHVILPARREPIELKTADGLTLVGELALPLDREPVATLVTFHPLPTAAGMMDSHVLRKAAWRLPALADIAVLRFNTRGTASARGRSEGEFGGGVSERFDVAAAFEFAEGLNEAGHELPNLWALGWSFGSELVLKYACEPDVLGAILLSPPLHRAQPDDLRVWGESGKPVTVLVPEFDDYLRPAEASSRRRRSSASTAPSTCGSARSTCASCSTRSCAGSIRPPRRCRWSGTVHSRSTPRRSGRVRRSDRNGRP